MRALNRCFLLAALLLLPLVSAFSQGRLTYLDEITWLPEEPLESDRVTALLEGNMANPGIDMVYRLQWREEDRLFALLCWTVAHGYVEQLVAPWEVVIDWGHIPPGDYRVTIVLRDSVSVDDRMVVDNRSYESQITVRADDRQIEFTLELRRGWNLISLPLRPHAPAIPDVFAVIDDQGQLIFVKDWRGRFYWPAEEFNNLPPWNSLEGYLVKVSEACEVTAEGRPTPPDFTIPLAAGWNMIAYLPEEEQEAPEAFSEIVDDLIIAKDGFGNFYLPAEPFNNIPPLRQGQGFQVKVERAIEMIWSLP